MIEVFEVCQSSKVSFTQEFIIIVERLDNQLFSVAIRRTVIVFRVIFLVIVKFIIRIITFNAVIEFHYQSLVFPEISI